MVDWVMVVFITMAPQSISAKTTRRGRAYRSELRQQQAEQTRSRVVAAAVELFADNGYARTTLAKIADKAGVSPETVQGHGPKAALMIAAIEYAAFGVAGEEDVFNLDMGRRFLAVPDRDAALDYLAAAQTEVHERTARLTRALFGGAGADPELDRYLADFMAGIDTQARRLCGVCRDRGWLRDDMPFDEVVETGGVICSVETYLRITHRDGWTATRYRKWLRRMLAETVFR
jgi:AcrR family transcriptional regulator